MSVQARVDIDNRPFILSGEAFNREPETIKQDAGRAIDLTPLTLMGRSQVVVGAITPTLITGDGTVTGFALAPGGPPRAGAWNLECTVAAAEGGTFKLEDPDGNIVANDLAMIAGAGLTTTFIVAGMTFIITDGAADFVVGDKFALAITADGDIVPFSEAAVNGGARVAGIYVGGTILTATIVAGDVTDRPLIVGGNFTFDGGQLVIEGTATLDTVTISGRTIREEMAVLGMFAEDTVDIDEYEI